MQTHIANIDDALPIGYDDHESVVIALDVENDAIIPDQAGIAVSIFDVGRSTPIGLFDVMIPRPKRLLGIGVLLPEVTQGLQGDDPHRVILPRSQHGSKFLDAGEVEGLLLAVAHEVLEAEFEWDHGLSHRIARGLQDRHQLIHRAQIGCRLIGQRFPVT